MGCSNVQPCDLLGRERTVAESFDIGRNPDFAGNAFDGRIATVLVYDTVLGPSEVEAVEAYLNQVYLGEMVK